MNIIDSIYGILLSAGFEKIKKSVYKIHYEIGDGETDVWFQNLCKYIECVDGRYLVNIDRNYIDIIFETPSKKTKYSIFFSIKSTDIKNIRITLMDFKKIFYTEFRNVKLEEILNEKI